MIAALTPLIVMVTGMVVQLATLTFGKGGTDALAAPTALPGDDAEGGAETTPPDPGAQPPTSSAKSRSALPRFIGLLRPEDARRPQPVPPLVGAVRMGSLPKGRKGWMGGSPRPGCGSDGRRFATALASGRTDLSLTVGTLLRILRSMLTLPSRSGLELLVALDQLADAPLAPLAAAGDLPLTSAQSALGRLLALGLVVEDGARRYRVANVEAADLLVRYALGSAEAQAIALRANPAVLFAGRDQRRTVVAFDSTRRPASTARLRRRLSGREDIELVDVSGLGPAAREAWRSRAEQAEAIVGSPARAFPRPAHGGVGRGLPLGAANKALRRPSRRALEAIARRFGLRRLVLFGSAVRDDFDEESDVDLLAEPRRDARLSITSLTRLENELSELFGRQAEVVTPGGLRPEIARDIAAEGVVLYG